MAHTGVNVHHKQELLVVLLLWRMIHFIFIAEDFLWGRWTFSPWLGGNWGIWVWWQTFPDFAMEVNERAKIRILKFRPTLFAPIKLLHSRQPFFTISCLLSGGSSLSIWFFLLSDFPKTGIFMKVFLPKAPLGTSHLGILFMAQVTSGFGGLVWLRHLPLQRDQWGWESYKVDLE